MIRRFLKRVKQHQTSEDLAIGSSGQVNRTLNILRTDTQSGALGDVLEFLPGLALHTDPQMNIHGSYASPIGRLLEIKASMDAPGEWCALHISLPVSDLTHYGIVGFSARFSAGSTDVIRACLRSGTGDNFQDRFFDKHLLLRPEEASHLDALFVHHIDGVPIKSDWRELILFLPVQNFELSLIDLRVFVV